MTNVNTEKVFYFHQIKPLQLLLISFFKINANFLSKINASYRLFFFLTYIDVIFKSLGLGKKMIPTKYI